MVANIALEPSNVGIEVQQRGEVYCFSYICYVITESLVIETLVHHEIVLEVLVII